MKKSSGYGILVVILVVFSVVAFIAPFERTSIFWASYIFGVISVAFQIPVWKKVWEKQI